MNLLTTLRGDRPAAADDTARRVVYQVASWLLSYPDEQLDAQLPLLRQALGDLPPAESATLTGFVDHLAGLDAGARQRAYVDVFDLSRRHALYLSYYTDGDTRRRGEVLAGFKQRYRACGFLVDTRGELPDFLPLVLEYAAVADPEDGLALLTEYRPSLELLRIGLVEEGSAYASVVAAICSTLPGESPADRAAVMAMAAAGPPVEHVGLEEGDPRLLPFAVGGDLS